MHGDNTKLGSPCCMVPLESSCRASFHSHLWCSRVCDTWNWVKRTEVTEMKSGAAHRASAEHGKGLNASISKQEIIMTRSVLHRSAFNMC